MVRKKECDQNTFGSRQALVWTQDAARGRYVAESLREEGFSVSLVTSSTEAAAALCLGKGGDLLVAELDPADAEGEAEGEAAAVARWKGMASTVLVASKHPSPLQVRSLIGAGAYDVLGWPLKAAEVQLALHKAAAREGVLGDRTAGRFLPEQTDRNGVSAGTEGILAESKAMQELLRQIRKVAVHKTPVLLLGESGTGKEVLARAIHRCSPRQDGPFIAINCGALPETLLESLLFGHVQGAFTDAFRDEPGVFRQASLGTLFLDEIGELPLKLQVKLLRVLQEQKILPVGSTQEVAVDVRVLAATLRNLSKEVEAGRFRADLYYRLSVVELCVPPLRERPEDILPLAFHVLRRTAQRLGRPIVSMSPSAQQALQRYPFPGNVRELENLIERAVVLCEKTRLESSDLPFDVVSGFLTKTDWEKSGERGTLGEEKGGTESRVSEGLGASDLSIKTATMRIEKELIARALHRTGGNRSAAARLLDLSHRALLYKLREYGFSDEPPKASKPK